MQPDAATRPRRFSSTHRPLPLLERFRRRVRKLKAETLALYLASRHPQTPWYAKLVVAAIVAYAFSPIDLIPDFIPVLGLMDELVVLPLGIVLALALIPPHVMTECRARAEAVMKDGKPVSRAAGVVIVVIWAGLAALGILWGYEALSR
jgi:uncharacterized membrane protein YkvA (DUF1232 family)